jgi:cytochrome c551/c552
MKNLIFVVVILLLSCNAGEDKRLIPPQPTVMQEEEKTDGEILFKNNCANCHKPDKDFTGPALKGSLERWGNDKKAMYAFIRNPGKSVNKNKYVKEMSRKWEPALMTAFPNLTNEELDKIMSYCEKYERFLGDSIVVCAF